MMGGRDRPYFLSLSLPFWGRRGKERFIYESEIGGTEASLDGNDSFFPSLRPSGP